MASTPEAVRLYEGRRYSYLRSSRLFYVDPTDHAVEGWYFKVRGPRYYGPYPSRCEAAAALDRMLCEFQAKNETGGR